MTSIDLKEKTKTNGHYSAPCGNAENATHACYELHQYVSECNNVWNHGCIARGVCVPFLCCVDCVNCADTARETVFSPSGKACCSRESLGTKSLASMFSAPLVDLCAQLCAASGRAKLLIEARGSVCQESQLRWNGSARSIPL